MNAEAETIRRALVAATTSRLSAAALGLEREDEGVHVRAFVDAMLEVEGERAQVGAALAELAGAMVARYLFVASDLRRESGGELSPTVEEQLRQVQQSSVRALFSLSTYGLLYSVDRTPWRRFKGLLADGASDWVTVLDGRQRDPRHRDVRAALDGALASLGCRPSNEPTVPRKPLRARTRGPGGEVTEDAEKALASAIRRAREGAAKVVVLAGPPGAGKSTLVQALIDTHEGALRFRPQSPEDLDGLPLDRATLLIGDSLDDLPDRGSREQLVEAIADRAERWRAGGTVVVLTIREAKGLAALEPGLVQLSRVPHWRGAASILQSELEARLPATSRSPGLSTALERVALELHLGGRRALDLDAILSLVGEDDAPWALSFLVRSSRGTFELPSLWLQEYLAAKALVEKAEEGTRQLAERFADPWWREVLLLFLEIVPEGRFEDLVRPVAGKLAALPGLLRACLTRAAHPTCRPFIPILRAAAVDDLLPVLSILAQRADAALADFAADHVTAPDDRVRSLSERIVQQVGRDVREAPRTKTTGDVELVYDLADAPAVREIARKVREDGANPVEHGQATGGRSVPLTAVFVGASRTQPWTEERRRRRLAHLVGRGSVVRPVLLPGASVPPPLPPFLRDFSWMRAADLRWAENLAAEATGRPRPAQRLRRSTVSDTTVAPSPVHRRIAGVDFLFVRHSGGHGFWMKETCVSNEEYAAFVAAHPDARAPGGWSDPRFSRPSQPVVGVSWFEGDAYARWFGRSATLQCALPTAEEWSLAASGGDARAHPWGDAPPDPHLACFGSSLDNADAGPSEPSAHARGAGPFGHLDLLGNVWEWCSDVLGDERPLRGGSWLSDAAILYLPAATRRAPATTRAPDIGFRIIVRVPGGNS